MYASGAGLIFRCCKASAEWNIQLCVLALMQRELGVIWLSASAVFQKCYETRFFLFIRSQLKFAVHWSWGLLQARICSDLCHRTGLSLKGNPVCSPAQQGCTATGASAEWFISSDPKGCSCYRDHFIGRNRFFFNDVYLPISRLIVVWVVYFLCLNGRLDVL